MRIIYFLTLLTMSFAASAEVLQVKYGLFQYRLDLKPQRLSLSGKGLDLTVNDQKCNHADFEEFSRAINVVIEKMPVKKGKKKNQVEVSTEKKESFYSRKSSQGKYFLSLPDRIKTLKIKSELNCGKS